jgi:hypothetical protein
MDAMLIIAAVAFGTGSMASAVLGWANRQHLIVIHKTMNGRLDELLALTASVSEARGVRMGRDEYRQLGDE